MSRKTARRARSPSSATRRRWFDAWFRWSTARSTSGARVLLGSRSPRARSARIGACPSPTAGADEKRGRTLGPGLLVFRSALLSRVAHQRQNAFVHTDVEGPRAARGVERELTVALHFREQQVLARLAEESCGLVPVDDADRTGRADRSRAPQQRGSRRNRRRSAGGKIERRDDVDLHAPGRAVD